MRYMLHKIFRKSNRMGDKHFGLDQSLFILSLVILLVTVLMPMVDRKSVV